MIAPISVELLDQQAYTNPFPGLRPFRAGEEHLFFGRERKVDALINKLSHRRFLAIVGTSGSGKSSLVNCGLTPALYRGLMASAGSSWKIAQFRPGRQPIHALAHALASADMLNASPEGAVTLDQVIETHLRITDRGLVNLFQKAKLPARTNLLVVADQFEEIFRFRKAGQNPDMQQGATEEAKAFVNLLLTAAQSRARIYVVLTMRSDFLGDCAQFDGLPEAINDGQFLIPRMSRDERREAIAGPIAVGNGAIDPALLTRLVNDVGDNPDQLSILQHALNRTWARWKASGVTRPISLDDYEAIGTMARALDQHAEKAFGEVAEQGLSGVCERMFRTLTDRSTDARGIRRPVEFGELCSIAGARPEDMKTVIASFRKPSRSFVMPPVPEELDATTMIDISHESLMRVWTRLRLWADEEAQSAAMYRRLSETARLNAEHKAGEWKNPDLQSALDWLAKEKPTAGWASLYGGNFEPAMAFLERSRQVYIREEAELRFERGWRSFWGPAGVVLGVIGTLSLFDRIWALTRSVLEPTFGTSPFVRLSAATSTVTLFFGFYILFERYGKAALHRVTISRIVKQVAEPVKSKERSAAGGLHPNMPELPATKQLYAAFWRRLLAAVIDLPISFSLGVICIGVFQGLGINTDSGASTALLYAVWIPACCLYQVLTITSKWQGTIGMRVAQIHLTDLRGDPLTWKRVLLRHVAKILVLYTVWIGGLMPLWTKRRQTIHDLVVGSVVFPGVPTRKA